MEQTPRRDEEPEVGYILLTLRAVWEDGQYASFCDELGVASCGDTVDEALASIREAVELHLLELVDLGQLENELRERNIRVDFDEPLERYRIPVEFAESSSSPMPTYQFQRHAVLAPA